MAWTKLSIATRNTLISTLSDLIDGGYIALFTDPVPVSVEEAISGQNILAILEFSSPPFAPLINDLGQEASGYYQAEPIQDETSALADGTATWARVYNSDGVGIIDIDVGTGGASLILDNTYIELGDTVSINVGAILMPN